MSDLYCDECGGICVLDEDGSFICEQCGEDYGDCE